MSGRVPVVGYHGGSEQFAPAELVELAVAAEAAGFQGLTLSDHFHPWQDNQGHAGHAWLMLSAAGQRTERLLLGSSVTCPIYRYRPAEVAHAFATLASLYPGRVSLGVGTGEAVNELPAGGSWGPHSERLARFIEAVTIIRRLWTEERVEFDGAYFTMRSAKLYDRPGEPPPLYVAASGPRAARVAGRYGDGWITDIATLRNAPVREAFAAGAREAGKDPETMPLIVELWPVLGTREDALAAARCWLFLPVFEDVVDVADPREVQRIAESRSSPERVVERWLVSSDPADHVAAIRDLAELGVTHVFVHPPQDDQRAVIDFYGQHVLPALRP